MLPSFICFLFFACTYLVVLFSFMKSLVTSYLFHFKMTKIQRHKRTYIILRICGSVVYFIVPFSDLWLFCGRWFGLIDRSQSSGHVGSCNTSTSTPARLEYSSSFLKSIGKAQPKSIIPSYLWNRLEDLGIRKRFRSRRGGHRSRHRSGYPVAQAAGLL